LEQHGTPNQYASRPDDARLAFVRICARYFAHGAWLEDEQLLKHADALEGIPAVLVHGRQDMSAPPDTAWKLARRWRSARLVIVDDAGHKGNEHVQQLLDEAFDAFGAGHRQGAPSVG
jgi:proline iminopeptidase